MSTGYTTVAATNLVDATGTPIANATISFSPVDNTGKPISFRAGGSGGQVVTSPVTALVTNGAFTITVADTSMTSPVNVGYAVTVVDNSTGDTLLQAGYGCVQPTGTTFSFDAYEPDFAAQVTVQVGPPGATGAAGQVNIPTLFAALTGSSGGNSVPFGVAFDSASGLSAVGDSCIVSGEAVTANCFLNSITIRFSSPAGGQAYLCAMSYNSATNTMQCIATTPITVKAASGYSAQTFATGTDFTALLLLKGQYLAVASPLTVGQQYYSQSETDKIYFTSDSNATVINSQFSPNDTGGDTGFNGTFLNVGSGYASLDSLATLVAPLVNGTSTSSETVGFLDLLPENSTS